MYIMYELVMYIYINNIMYERIICMYSRVRIP